MIPEKWHVTVFALCVLALAALILWWIERKPPKDDIRLPRKTLWERTNEFLKGETNASSHHQGD